MAKKKSTHGGARAGAGRPKIYKSLSSPTSVTLEADTKVRLDDYCRRHEITRSVAIQLAITKFLGGIKR